MMTFPIPPVSFHTLAILFAIIVLLSALGIGLVSQIRTVRLAGLAYVAAGLLCLLLAGGFGYVTYGSLHSAVILDEYRLVLKAPLYGRSIARDMIDLGQARPVDLNEADELTPRVRTHGIGIPGYQLGRFRLAGGTTATAALTDRSNVAYLPLKDGSVWLLSLQTPARFIGALRHGE